MNVIDMLDKARAQTNVLEHPFYERWSAGELSAGELALYAGEYRHAVLALAEASARAADAAEQPGHRAGLRRHAEEESAHVALWDEFARASAWRAVGGTPVTGTVPVADAPQRADADAPQRADADAPQRADADALQRADADALQRADADALQRAGADALQRAGADADGRPLRQTETCARAWTAGADLLERLAVLYAIEASQPEISRTKLQGLIEHYGYTPDAPALEYFRLHEQLDVEHAREASELIGRLLDGHADPDGKAVLMVRRARAALEGNWLLLDGVLAAAPAAA